MSRPPSARSFARSPSGLLLPIHATVKGRVRWQTLDERGVPEIPRNPSGFAIGPIDGVEQPNLITDTGMDSFATSDLLLTATSSAAWRRFLAAGTGSVAPAVTDTALTAEVQRAASSGAYAAGSVSYADGGTTLDVVSVVNRVLTMTADRNLTEYGFALASPGNLHVRELFRDGGGIPVTISLLTDKILYVQHTATFELPWPAAGTAATIDLDEYDAANALIASTPYGVIHGLRAWNTSPSTSMSYAFHTWQPHRATMGGSSRPIAPRRLTAATAYARTGSIANMSPSGNTRVTGSDLALETYTAGTFQRLKRATMPAGGQTGVWYGVVLSGFTDNQNELWSSGHHVQFDSPATYDLASTDSIRFGILSTWARA